MRKTLALENVARQQALRLDSEKDLDPLLEKLSQSRVVMLGEATHGTHEFYDWRRIISQRLIEEHGFNFIAVEGDWPPCQHVNQYVMEGQGESAIHVLENFNRWPTW